MTNLFHKDIVLCECGNPEHQFIISYDKHDHPTWPAELVFYIHCSKKPLIKRFAYAFRYILGWQSKYGAFDEIIIPHDQAIKLKDHIEEYIKIRS